MNGPHFVGPVPPVQPGSQGGWDLAAAGGDEGARLQEVPPLMRVVSETVSIAGVDSNRIQFFFNTSNFEPASITGREFTPVFPLSNMLEGVVFKPPPINVSPGTGLPLGHLHAHLVLILLTPRTRHAAHAEDTAGHDPHQAPPS